MCEVHWGDETLGDGFWTGFYFNTNQTMFICSSSFFVLGTPSGLGHYEFIAHLLLGLYKNSYKLRSYFKNHSFYKNADKLRGVFYKNLLVGDYPILCGHEQAFQGTPRTSQRIAACWSLTAKKSYEGPISATCGRVGHMMTLKTPRTIPWYVCTSAKPIESPVWSLA